MWIFHIQNYSPIDELHYLLYDLDFCYLFQKLTYKQLEMHGCIISTVATDVLMLKHQTISIHSVELIFIVLPKIHRKISHLLQTACEMKLHLKKKLSQFFKD